MQFPSFISYSIHVNFRSIIPSADRFYKSFKAWVQNEELKGNERMLQLVRAQIGRVFGSGDAFALFIKDLFIQLWPRWPGSTASVSRLSPTELCMFVLQWHNYATNVILSIGKYLKKQTIWKIYRLKQNTWIDYAKDKPATFLNNLQSWISSR